MLKIIKIGKKYNDTVALNDVSLTFPEKGLVIIKGESGCGKTTLLNLLTANDYPTSGKFEFDGVEITAKNAEEYRRQYCSCIYQDYMLIEGLTVRENIELGMQACGEQYTLDDIKELLKKVGITETYIDKKASKLSGGEKQRVSIARAIAKKHAMVFADEPTGNLDRKNGEKIMDLLKEISKERLVVVVSHNEKFNSVYADYTVKLVDGAVVECDLPCEHGEKEREPKKTANFETKSKLRPKMLARLAYWGFEKNKGKTIASIVAFVVLCIFSLVFTVVTVSDPYLIYAESLNNCKYKNVMVLQESIFGGLFGSSWGQSDSMNAGNIKLFKDGISHGCSEVYQFSMKTGKSELDQQAYDEYLKKYFADADISYAIIYNPEIGIDTKVIAGEFPKEANDVMIPLCYAKFLTSVCKDYKSDEAKSLVGKELECGKETAGYYPFRICGIFDEGKYFDDYDSVTENVSEYFQKTNYMAASVIVSEGIKQIWFDNAYLFNTYSFPKTIRIGNKNVNPFGYNVLEAHANNYPSLQDDEVYLDKKVAQSLGIKVGDKLTNTIIKDLYDNYNFDGLIVKDIVDLPDRPNCVIFSSDYFMDNIVWDLDVKIFKSFKGFYFNMKKVKDVYGFFKQINAVGYEQNLVMEPTQMSSIYMENLYAAKDSVSMFTNYRYIAFLPLMLASFIGMIALGFVSITFLISSKIKSYNTLRSLGFDQKNIALVLFVQILTVIVIQCVLGLALGALTCHLFGKAIAVILCGGEIAGLSTDVPMPVGFIAPLIVVGVSLLLGLAIVLAKTRSLFAKSVMENKTN